METTSSIHLEQQQQRLARLDAFERRLTEMFWKADGDALLTAEDRLFFCEIITACEEVKAEASGRRPELTFSPGR